MSGPGKAVSPDELPVNTFGAAADFDDWLKHAHASSLGTWLRIAKKSAVGDTAPTVTYDEAVDVALCWGWIDGQRRRLDDTHFLQRFTPRGPRSIWSQINRERVARLRTAGRFQPAGDAAVETAMRNGQWERAYSGQAAATIPPDLAEALDRNPQAQQAFSGLDSRNRYAILHRVQTAKKPETRAARIQTFVEMLAEGRTIHPASGKAAGNRQAE